MSTPHTTQAPAVALTITPREARIDSRLIATQLRNQHRPVMALINKYREQFEKFGKLFFEKAPSANSRTGQAEGYALLNEDQAFFLLSLSRNTDHVVALKAKLIAAFGEARRAAEHRSAEYLPTYHVLHDEIAAKAANSSNQRFVHMNVNRLVNRAVGLESGQRLVAPLATQSMVTVCQTIAAKAMHSAPDHHVGYQRAKQALNALSAVAMLEGA